MKITLQGFGDFNIESTHYKKFIDILNLEDDLFLHILDLSKILIPIICINIDNIESEGPIPYGFNKTQIGIDRFEKLEKEGVITI